MGAFLVITSCAKTPSAKDDLEGDTHINGYFPKIHFMSLQGNKNYTLLNQAQYQTTVQNAQKKISDLLIQLQTYHTAPLNTQVAFLAQQLSNTPYIFIGGMGEGDWQPASQNYQGGAAHIQQDPVYRLDGLNCQTYVQLVISLLHSQSLADFEPNYLKISYGAAGNPAHEIVHYYNRNNFIEGDFNPINQKNNFLKDVTTGSPDTATMLATIQRNKWFAMQQHSVEASVRVFNDALGKAMSQKFSQVYSALPYPHFDRQTISTSYFPKEKIALKQAGQSYLPNKALLNSIPTPAVVEIVRDPRKWTVDDKLIKEAIGTELTISHLGLLFRQTFHQGDVIYQKITCSFAEKQQKVCTVKPVVCQQASCDELMLSHATDAFPNDYYWYQKPDGSYTCTSDKPASGNYTMCNRVRQLPLFDYLTDYQYGSYLYMDSPSLVGIHVEELL
jgi:hypothetical protein